MKRQISSAILLLAVVLLATLPEPAGAQGNPNARIVRLSFVEGKVVVQRPDVSGWAEAPANTPLQEGFQISTAENSFAEIQFEDGSAIRLGQLTLLDLTELALNENGGRINHVGLRQGYGTFHPLPGGNGGDSLQVTTPEGTLVAAPGAEFRVDLDEKLERVEVFRGSVDVQSDFGLTTLGGEDVLLIQPDANEHTVTSQGITPDDWDNWVAEREALAEAASSGPSAEDYGGEGSTYGWTDLGEYGNWSYVPGAGYGWMPTGTGSGWSPYSMGEWCWYPGFGFTWIGTEPWGWLPYHYGSWEYIAGAGWVWFPGSFGTWSPAQVAWFQGAGWIGWAPRPRRPHGPITCEKNCGGGVVSTSTFRQGGRLSSNLLIRVNPTSGERVREPGVLPATSVRLAGPTAPAPVTSRPNLRPTTAASVAPSRGLARTAVPDSSSSIVYDPQQGRYLNGTVSPAPAPSSRAVISPSTLVAHPGMVQSAPGAVRPRGPEADPTGVPAGPPTGSVGASGFAPRPSPAPPATPRSAPVVVRPASGGEVGAHISSGTVSSGHASAPATSSGGHTGGGAVGGGHH